MGSYFSRIPVLRMFVPAPAALTAAEPHEGEKYEHMTTEDKRKLYKCGDRYVTLEGVKSWSQYYKHQRSRSVLKNVKEARGRNVTTSYPVRTDLNEKVSLWRGDITTLEIDAIVNAANNSLMGGGGVDGAIHSAAGASLLRAECGPLKGCNTGDAKITSGYKLPARYIIHTVGPIGVGGKNELNLRSCYSTCLGHMVGEKQLKSIAFPCISTGIYGYPNDAAAIVALETTRKWLESNADAVDRVIFCLFLPVDVALYEKYMLSFFPVDEPGGDEKSPPATETAEAKTEDPQTDKQATDKEAKAVNEDKKPTKEAGDDKDEIRPVNGAKVDSKTEEAGGEDAKESCEDSSDSKVASDHKVEAMEVDGATDGGTPKTKDDSSNVEPKVEKEAGEDVKKPCEDSSDNKGAAKTESTEAKAQSDAVTPKTEGESLNVEARVEKKAETSTEELGTGAAEEGGMDVEASTDGETVETKKESVEPTDKKKPKTSTDAPKKPAVEKEAMNTETQHETKTNETSGNEDTQKNGDTKDCDEMEIDDTESGSRLQDLKREPIHPEKNSEKSAL